jgi:hypothetical protein
MLFPGMVCYFPSGVYDWSFADFDYAIAGTKSGRRRSLDEVNVRPLKSMAVNIVGDLTE